MRRFIVRRGVKVRFHGLAMGVLVSAIVVVPMAWGNTADAAAHHVRASGACDARSSRVAGVGGGVQWGRATTGTTTCAGVRRSRGAGGGTPPSNPYRGLPPLINHGGAVVGTATPGELTVTPVYWVPTGGAYPIPTAYRNLVNRFIADAATDSGKLSNVFASVHQYTNATGTRLAYKIHAGTAIVDSSAFPANGCTPDAGQIWSDGTPYSKCITNSQLLSEASSFTTAHGLPNTDLAHLYVYFLPKGVETCFTGTNGAGGGSCSINARPGFCGYHAFAAPPLVADMNYAVVDSPTGWTCSSDAGSNTGGNQSPNANIDADTEISIASHEISETITDPEGNAWFDAVGNENGDDCAYIYGDSLSFQGAAGARYNQTIHGHHYFIQEEFSNQDFNTVSAFSCIQGEDFVKVAPTSGAAGTAVSLTGGGFASGEAVKVSYATGLASPKSVVLCTTTATGTGTFACSGHIPPVATAGAAGKHKLTAKGAGSLRQPTVSFTRT